MKILVRYEANARAYGTHGDSALIPGEEWYVVPTENLAKALPWIRAHLNFRPNGRRVKFYTEDGTDVTLST